MEVCEYCGKMVKKTKAVSFTDVACVDCLRLIAQECATAADDLEEEIEDEE